MVKIYTDTNALRYFGKAFAKSSLPTDLRDHLFLSPLSVMELLSQLGTNNAGEAFSAVHAFPRVHNPEASGMLPWSDIFLRMCLFGLPPEEDPITPALNRAVVNVLNAEHATDLENAGKEMRALLDFAKDWASKDFAAVLSSLRTDGDLPEAQHREIFANSIATRANVEGSSVDIDFIAKSLDAFFTFEKQRMKVAAKNRDYNIQKHSNDTYDAELLIYLADPSLHLLTSDTGFRRVDNSSQADRVHIVDPACLCDADQTAKLIRSIVMRS